MCVTKKCANSKLSRHYKVHLTSERPGRVYQLQLYFPLIFEYYLSKAPQACYKPYRYHFIDDESAHNCTLLVCFIDNKQSAIQRRANSNCPVTVVYQKLLALL